MKCDKIEKKFLKLENYDSLPLSITLHILFCKNCKTKLNFMQKQFLDLQNKSLHSTASMNNLIMSKINAKESRSLEDVSFWPWFMSGSFIFSGTILISYSDTFSSLKKYFGDNIELPMYIILGLCLTIFSGMFVSSHLERMKKYFKF